MGRFDGKVVSIVGAASDNNMVEVMARRFAAESAKVVVSGSHKETPSSLVEDIDGSIIQISSAAANIMLDDHAAYMGTKAGTDHLVRCVANQYGSKGIRANSISPGLTATPMTAEPLKSAALLAEYESCYPFVRIGTSEDVAAAATFLASDECFMTGENLQVNGGLCLYRNPLGTELVDAMVSAGEIPSG
jgi:NAD(P)-dependent dehydrogenase (short-subunit alcohol dehydrogenase family)